jgi:hypothetical protein
MVTDHSSFPTAHLHRDQLIPARAGPAGDARLVDARAAAGRDGRPGDIFVALVRPRLPG